ncbi:MAG: hypothetical protein F8N15_09025 [Methanobacterium sp.]|nr:hypothetical protein [Methanobacterium sp.]
MTGIDLIVAYVEGKLSSDDFEIYLNSNKELEDLLSEDIKILPYTRDGSIYLYLQLIDMHSPGGRLNSQEALSKFLDAKGVQYSTNSMPKKIFSIIMKAQPKWLDIPDFYINNIIPPDLKVSQDALVSYAKYKIDENFIFLKKPPKWLQSPQWMFRNGRPLKFVGQIDIGGIRHDEAQLYVFYDDESKEFFTTEQSV